MRILGIDPGYDRMGVAVIDKTPRSEIILYSGCLSSKTKADFPDRLLELGLQVEKIIKEWKPEVLSLEKLFLTKNQKTATNVSETRGLVIYLAKKAGLEIAQYTPLEIKMAITGYGRADKSQMTEMIKKLLNMGNDKKLDDEYDALGAALTYSARCRFPL